MKTVLRLTGAQHNDLREHLFPDDGWEAAAFAVCGRRAGASRHILTVKEIVPIPYADCPVRTPVRVTWNSNVLLALLERAMKSGEAIVKFHSHRGDYPWFSETDDLSDRDFFSSADGWTDTVHPHASCVMLPDGKMFGRTGKSGGEFEPLSLIAVAGDDLLFWHAETKGDSEIEPEFALRHIQAFGDGTFNILRRLSVAVVGCSGTGSPLIEQLARLGIGRLVLVDPDIIEHKNLNRIVNAAQADAERNELKVEVLARAVRAMGTGVEVVPIADTLFNPEVILTVAECDLAFGCMDSAESRQLLNRLAVFYNLPYIDLGVSLDADGAGSVENAACSVHYLQPGRSSLMSRGMFTPQDLYEESLKRTNPDEYDKQLQEKYIRGVAVDRPAVISLNMLAASVAVNELLARIHRFRDDENSRFAATIISLTQGQTYHRKEGEACRNLSRHVGRGDVDPLIDSAGLEMPPARAKQERENQ